MSTPRATARSSACRSPPARTAADIEIAVGEPVLGRLGAEPLARYSLGLYATEEYLRDHGAPRSTGELRGHSLIYYIDGVLRVEDLTGLGRLAVGRHAAFAFTSVHVQIVGLLPAYVADRDPALRRVLFPDVRISLQFTAWMASGRLRHPAWRVSTFGGDRSKPLARRRQLTCR